MNTAEKITVYSAEVKYRPLYAYLFDVLHDLPKGHELGLRLFKRNLKANYRQSLLGFLWAILPALFTSGLWIFLLGGNVIKLDHSLIPYPVFVLTGTLLWQVFAEAILAPINQVSENRVLLAKINIPYQGLLLAGLYQLLFNIAIKMLLLVFVFIYFGQSINIVGLILGFLSLASLVLAGFAIGLVLTPFGLLLKDIERGLSTFLPFLMYITPVVYPMPHEGTAALIMKLNPLSTLLTETRNLLTSQPVSNFPLFALWTALFVLLFLLGLVVYNLAMPIIIERIGT